MAISSDRSAPAATLIADAVGVIQSAGGAVMDLFGTEASDLVGTAASALFSTSAGPVRMLDADNPRRWEGIVVRPPAPGTPRAVSVFPMLGAVAGTVIVVSAADADHDQAESALRSSNAQLEAFASVAAHDLQEPLRKIRAFSDRTRLLLEAGTIDKAVEHLGRVDAAAARMQTLITDLLALARLSGRAPERTRMSLDDTLDAVMQDLSEPIRRTGATIERAPLPEVIADPSQMRQLFTNLIGNSLKYHRPDVTPLITITAEVVDGRATLIFGDNGIGFSDQYLPKIFAPFERLHGRDEYEGTGVGLALCRTIVERHGGTISAHGRPGEGADFIVDLPAS